ncbi:uncharacterized protein EDB93DRAFT_1249620 [Suillus bovinus]|uniref:uncharacterized protein n=1 Tax=Suillus bovinus TaxID=48563 RepID=UPI001B86E1FA|nr:uncharacterized protein EDB93DRAFT_1249620 [Suillus bovinus]KAG2151130.1 hypothetical protein EDB93DRAFT_1249620 [Suillus bovinus]
MSRPATRASNANKHPGDIVRTANRQQRSKEEIAAEKKNRNKINKRPRALQQNKHAPRLPCRKMQWPLSNKLSLQAHQNSLDHDQGLTFLEKKGTEPQTDPGDAQPIKVPSNWVSKVKLSKPSVPTDVHTTVPDDINIELDNNIPEKYEPRRGGDGKAVDSEFEEAADPKDEEALEMLDDPNTAVNGDDGEDQIQDSDVDMKVAVCSTTSMSVDVSNKQTAMKRIKTEGATSKAASINLKKVKPRNTHIPDDIAKSWRATFLPVLMYWVGNSSYSWSIPEEDLSNVLYEISNCIGGKNQGVHDFEYLTRWSYQAVQKIHEWKASFGSTAITILMTFFTATNPEYETQAARKSFANDQLEDSCFIYKNPDRHEKVDTLDSGMIGFETALALMAAAVERALSLVYNNYLVPCDPSDSNKKNHKIELTFNESTNRMSHTGTAFSAANWETEMKAYMDMIMELPESQVKEIIS